MENNWKKYKFSDFVEINPTIRFSKDELYSFVEMKDLNENNKFTLPSTEKSVTGGARFEENDTLFARITPCLQNGKICQVKGLKNKVGFGSTEFLVFRGKNGISDTNFVYYLSREEGVRKFAEQNMIGTSGRQRVVKDSFHNLILELPPLPEQEAIAEILSSLDDKIELNLQTNKTLEEMANALYKHWFVDFGPFKEGKFVESDLGMIPEGWEVRGLDDVAEFLNGLALQKFPPSGLNDLPVIKIRELKNGISNSTDYANNNLPEKYILKDGDIIFSWSGSLELVIWCNGRGALNQHLFKVTPIELPAWLIYFYVNQHMGNFKSIATNKATTMGHIQRIHLTEAKICLPKKEDLINVDSLISPLYDLIIKNNIENNSLKQTRDYLLPKLISGEIRVKEAVNSVKQLI
jgi:type I restriction enzyme S subunit